MATLTFYNAGKEALVEGINAGTDTWRLILSNTAPDAADAVQADAAELTTANGYTANGVSCTTVSSSQTAGTYKLVLSCASPTWTATGALSFRYVILWNQTANALVGYWDYGSTVSMVNTDTFTVSLDGTNGVFSVA